MPNVSLNFHLSYNKAQSIDNIVKLEKNYSGYDYVVHNNDPLEEMVKIR